MLTYILSEKDYEISCILNHNNPWRENIDCSLNLAKIYENFKHAKLRFTGLAIDASSDYAISIVISQS